VRDETVTTRRTEEAERDAERWASIGAGALVQGGVVCDPVTGDVLHDYDWTPIEAARAVLEAVNFAGAVAALESIVSYAYGASGATGDDAGHLTAVGMMAKEALATLRGQ
jgi:hypothetical protein